jgi:predicted kinase
MLIAMAGLPGAGKTMMAEILGGRLAASVVSVDPIEAAILHAGIDSDQPTGLAAYLVAETITEALIVSGHSVIVDAVNAVDPAREQWVRLAERQGESVKFIEVVCSDLDMHRQRLEHRHTQHQYYSWPSWRAVEQSLDEYASWSGPSASIPRITLDSVRPLGINVDAALAFVSS